MWKTNKITYANIKNVDIDAITKDLTLVIKNNLNKYGKNLPDKKILLYSYIENYIVVPRFYVKNAMECFKLQEQVIFNGIPVDCISNNQKIIYEKLVELYARPFGCNLILGTGQGKTYIATKLIQYIKRPTLIVTHSKEIAAEWFKVLSKYLGLQPGMMSGNKKEYSVVTVGTIQTLIKQPKEWFNYEFVVYDEITEFVSDKRRIIFQLAAKPFLLGLTATPDVKLCKIFELYIGPRLYAKKINGYQESEIKWKINVHAIKYYGDENFTRPIYSKIGMISAVEMNKQFMNDDKRNSLIISKIKWLRSKDIKVFVFVSICEFGDILYNMCLEHFDAEQMVIFMGSRKKESIVNKNIIFTTYSFCSKGISIPTMTGIILCQPRMADIEQTIGRITRIGGDVSLERYIIDIIDMNTSLKKQFSIRKKVYKDISKIEYFECN